jgi:hypothetical protein
MSVVLLENLTKRSDSQNPRIYFVDNLVTFLHTGYLNPVTTWSECHHHSSVISPTSFPRGVAVLSVAFGQLSVFLGQAANWVASSLSSGNASALFIYKWHSLLYMSISKLALIFETRSSGLAEDLNISLSLIRPIMFMQPVQWSRQTIQGDSEHQHNTQGGFWGTCEAENVFFKFEIRYRFLVTDFYVDVICISILSILTS